MWCVCVQALTLARIRLYVDLNVPILNINPLLFVFLHLTLPIIIQCCAALTLQFGKSHMMLRVVRSLYHLDESKSMMAIWKWYISALRKFTREHIISYHTWIFNGLLPLIRLTNDFKHCTEKPKKNEWKKTLKHLLILYEYQLVQSLDKRLACVCVCACVRLWTCIFCIAMFFSLSLSFLKIAYRL